MIRGLSRRRRSVEPARSPISIQSSSSRLPTIQLGLRASNHWRLVEFA